MDYGLANGIYSNKLEGNATGLYDSIRTGLHNGIYNENIIDNGIVKNGLVLYLDAANPYSSPYGSTTWKDLSGNGNNATLVNGAYLNYENKGTIFYDGINDYGEIPNNASLNSNIGTVSFWFKVKTITGVNNAATVLGKYEATGSASSTLGYDIYCGTTALRDSFVIGALITGSTTATRTWTTATPLFPINTWINFTMTFNSGVSYSIYYNGIRTNTASLISFTVANRELRMARGLDAFWGILSGNYGIVQMYNRELTPTEVAQNYNATKSRFGY